MTKYWTEKMYHLVTLNSKDHTISKTLFFRSWIRGRHWSHVLLGQLDRRVHVLDRVLRVIARLHEAVRRHPRHHHGPIERHQNHRNFRFNLEIIEQRENDLFLFFSHCKDKSSTNSASFWSFLIVTIERQQNHGNFRFNLDFIEQRETC